MARVGLLLAAIGVALAAGSAAPAKIEGRLFALHGTQAAQYVVELDPESLAALPQRRLKIGVAGPGGPWSHDPSRHLLAVAIGQRLRIIDLSRLRVVRTAKLGVYAKPTGVLWLRPDRIVVLQRVATEFDIVVFDAKSLRVVSRRRVAGGVVVDSERTASEVVLLLAPSYTIGPARLLVIDGVGETREISLDRVRAGRRLDDTDPAVSAHLSPALAVDAARRCVYVVSPDGVVAEVPFADAAVRYRTLHGRYAKLTSGESRDAFVVDGRLVISGSIDAISPGTDGQVGTSTGAGIQLVDLTTWAATRVAPLVSSITQWRNAIVATGGTWHSADGHRGIGLAVYGLEAKERLRVLDGKRLSVAAVYRDRAYAYAYDEDRMAIVDLVTGAVQRLPATALPWLLLEQGSPIW